MVYRALRLPRISQIWQGLFQNFLVILSLFSFGGEIVFGTNWNWTPRLETFQSEKTTNQRLFIKNNLDIETKLGRFYLEGFAEQNTNTTFAESSRLPPKGYLQEAYFESAWGDNFIRVGRQPVRWSEMWALPSLDIFTGRRYNRGFLDPLPEQLSHSTGFLYSQVGPRFSVDLYSLWEQAPTTYPKPLPEKDAVVRQSFEGGLRGKLDMSGNQISVVTATLSNSYVYGGAWSYAFENVVPKAEVGRQVWTKAEERLYQPTAIDFASVGLDLFWERWLLTPQMTVTTNDFDKTSNRLYYTNCSWIGDRHEFLFQSSLQEGSSNQFFHFGYTYKPTSLYLIQTFWQNYDGTLNSLYGTYKQGIGRSVVGVRVQVDYDILNR